MVVAHALVCYRQTILDIHHIIPFIKVWDQGYRFNDIQKKKIKLKCNYNEYYNYIKALHLIFVITWFAGLFYIPRLFIYILEAQKKPSIEKELC